MKSTWIGVDLDGTLAEFDYFRGWNHIGRPILGIVEMVKTMLAEGVDVRVFTARVAPAGSDDGSHVGIARDAIEAWCEQHVGAVLPVTCVKDVYCVRIYDDIAVAVQKNTGQLRHF